MAEWAEIKAILDDPNVSMDTKTRLMEEYDRNTFNFNAEEEEYAKKYVENYSDDGGNWRLAEIDDTDDIVKEAKAESQAKKQESQVDIDRRDQAKKNVDAMPAPALGSGTKTSDEMLDQGNVTVDWLAKWTDEIWNKRKGGSGNLNSQTDIKDKFHENRGIQFQKFLTEADDLTKAHKVVEDTLTKSDTELQTLFGEWKGKGANAAQIKYDETIKPHAKELQDQIAGAAKLIPETVTHVYDSLKKKIDEVLALQRPTIAEATIPMAADVLKIANGDTEEFDDFMKVAGWIDACNKKAGMDSNLADRLQNDDCGFNDENKEYGRQVTRFWRDGPFTKEFQSIITAFNGSCKTAKDTIDQQFGALGTFMDGYRNQLTEQPGQGGDPGKKDDGKTGTGDGNGNGKGAGTGTGTGTGTGGGGGTTTPSAAEPPKAEEPPKPEDGKNPITGKPLEIDPDTGQPYPIDPKTGEAIKDDGKTETVSVKKGDNTIEMTEPDKEGKMDVKVDDGQGHQKDYKLDFDDDKGEAKDGKTDAAGKDEGFGPKGSPQAVKEGQPSADGTYKPGPDGKIHIQDGDLKITAERPEGPDGPTVVTVDDGKGEPTTYTLDEQDDDKPELKTDDAKTDDAKSGDLKSDAKDTGSSVEHDKNAESPLTKDPAPANPDPGMTASAGAGGGGGFSTPGGLDLEGDLGGAEPGGADSGGGAGGGGSSDATTTAGADGLGSAVSGSTSGTLGDAVSLEPGAQTGSDAALPSSDAGLGMTPGGDPGASHAAAASAAPGGGMSGMGMMGGMGGAPGGGGGDTQRGSSQYRVEGNVFETSGAKGRISGSLDDDGGDRSIRYDR